MTQSHIEWTPPAWMRFVMRETPEQTADLLSWVAGGLAAGAIFFGNAPARTVAYSAVAGAAAVQLRLAHSSSRERREAAREFDHTLTLSVAKQAAKAQARAQGQEVQFSADAELKMQLKMMSVPDQIAYSKLYGLDQRWPNIAARIAQYEQQWGYVIPAAEPPKPLPVKAGAVIDTAALESDPQADAMAPLMAFAQHPANLFLVAKPGGGKAVFLSNYIRWRKQAEPELLVYLIDPKGDPKEQGYWAEPWIKHQAFQGAMLSPDDYAYELDAAFQDFQEFVTAHPGKPCLLIIDEALVTTEVLKSAEGRAAQNAQKLLITKSATLLDSINSHVVVVSQSPNAGDVGVSAGTLKTMTSIVVFRDGEFDTIQHAAKHGGVALDEKPTTAQLKRLCSDSPCGRGYYLQGALRPMPTLHNYSGFNRDKRAYEATTQTPSDAAQDFANAAGFNAHPAAEEISQADKLDDLADYRLLREWYQSLLPHPTGEELLNRWNEIYATRLLDDTPHNRQVLIIICGADDETFAAIAKELAEEMG